VTLIARLLGLLRRKRKSPKPHLSEWRDGVLVGDLSPNEILEWNERLTAVTHRPGYWERRSLERGNVPESWRNRL
jgi:hypothetical protein